MIASTASGTGLLTLLATALSAAALGRTLRNTRASRTGLARPLGALVAGVLALALFQRRRRRVSEIQRLLAESGAPEDIPVTQAVVPVSPADAPVRNPEQRLDEAVQETFPASDPIAVNIE